MKILFALLAGVVIGAAGLAVVSSSSGVEEVRIAARWLSSSRFEVGLQQRQADGAWGDVVEPASNVVDSRSRSWTFSSPVGVRPSATDGVVEFRVTAESIYATPAPIAETRCNFAFMYRSERSPVVWFSARAGEFCDGADIREPLLVLSDGQVPLDPEDPQAEHVSDWLLRVGERAGELGGDDLTLAEFEALVAYAYQDFLPTSARPPAVVYEADRTVTLHDFAEGEILTGLESFSPAWALNSIAYQLTAASDEQDEFEWSGPELAAQVLAVHERYVPGFDAVEARRQARRLGVLVAPAAPAAPVRRDSGVIVRVRQLLGLPDSANDAASDFETAPPAEARFTISPGNGVLRVSSPLGSAESQCDFFVVVRGFSAVWARPGGWSDCEDDGRLIPVGFAERAGVPFEQDDPQQYQVYDWERQIEANLLPAELGEEITVAAAQSIVNGVFADIMGRQRPAPRVREVDADGSEYVHRFRQIRLGPGGRNAATVLHETVHALLDAEADRSYRRWDGHGREYAATILMLWERYVPGFNGVRARADARLHGVDVAGASPLRPVGGGTGAAAVTERLGLPTVVAAQGDCIYVVAVGDTAFGIAARYGLTPEQLRALNPEIGNGFIEVGQELVVRCP